MLLYTLIQDLAFTARLSSCFGQKQGLALGAHRDEGREVSCKRAESEQFNSVRNLILNEI